MADGPNARAVSRVGGLVGGSGFAAWHRARRSLLHPVDGKTHAKPGRPNPPMQRRKSTIKTRIVSKIFFYEMLSDRFEPPESVILLPYDRRFSVFAPNENFKKISLI